MTDDNTHRRSLQDIYPAHFADYRDAVAQPDRYADAMRDVIQARDKDY
jgi:hypothetical protein